MVLACSVSTLIILSESAVAISLRILVFWVAATLSDDCTFLHVLHGIGGKAVIDWLTSCCGSAAVITCLSSSFFLSSTLVFFKSLAPFCDCATEIEPKQFKLNKGGITNLEKLSVKLIFLTTSPNGTLSFRTTFPLGKKPSMWTRSSDTPDSQPVGMSGCPQSLWNCYMELAVNELETMVSDKCMDYYSNYCYIPLLLLMVNNNFGTYWLFMSTKWKYWSSHKNFICTDLHIQMCIVNFLMVSRTFTTQVYVSPGFYVIHSASTFYM